MADIVQFRDYQTRQERDMKRAARPPSLPDLGGGGDSDRNV